MKIPRALLLAAGLSWACPSLAQTPLDRLRIDTPEGAPRGLVAFVQSQTRALTSVALSRDGRWLAASSLSNSVTFWRLGAGTPEVVLSAPASATTIVFHPDSKYAVSGNEGPQTAVWDISGEKPRQHTLLVGHKLQPAVLAISPDGQRLATGSFEPLLRLWGFEPADFELQAAILGLKTPTLSLTSLAFSHDGRYLVAGSLVGEGSLRAWDCKAAFLEELELPAQRARLVAASPTEPMLAYVGDGPEVRLVKLRDRTLEKVKHWPAHLVKALAFAPSGKTLATAGADRKVALWKIPGGELLAENSFPEEPRAVAWSADGRYLAVGGAQGGLFVTKLE